jgi:hypothetical protein
MATAATAAKTKPEETTNRCDTKKVKVGSVYSRHSFGTVTDIAGDTFTVQNEKGDSWQIGRTILEKEFSFAEQFDSEETVNRTRAIEVMVENPQTAMTIHYNKAPEVADKDGKIGVATALKNGQGAMSDKEWKKLVATQVAGEEREMIGHHFGAFDEHRRLHFVESGKGPRLVDPRTLNWLIVKRVKYTVK